MKNIDVWDLASENFDQFKENSSKDLMEFANKVSGKPYTQTEMLEQVITPLVSIINAKNMAFTVDLIQKVVNELQNEDAL